MSTEVAYSIDGPKVYLKVNGIVLKPGDRFFTRA